MPPEMPRHSRAVTSNRAMLQTLITIYSLISSIPLNLAFTPYRLPTPTPFYIACRSGSHALQMNAARIARRANSCCTVFILRMRLNNTLVLFGTMLSIASSMAGAGLHPDI